MGIPKEERKRNRGNSYAIMSENFSLIHVRDQTTKPGSSETTKQNAKITRGRHVIFKLQKIKDKGRGEKYEIN